MSALPASMAPERGLAARSRAASEIWWLHPLACIAMLGLLYASFLDFDFRRVVPNAYIPGWFYAWGAALLLTLAVGTAAVTVGRRWPAPPINAGYDVPPWAMGALLAMTLMAYAVWFAPVASNPALLFGVFTGDRQNLRQEIATMPGITTMTQFGVAYVVAYSIVTAGRTRPVAMWERIGLVLVFVLGMARALAWSERLAVIELVVAFSVARLAFMRLRSGSSWMLASILPLVAPWLLYLVFTGTEYFRSWQFYKREYDSIWAFSAERLTAYYALASNNGIGLLVENHQWPSYTGRYVAEWLYAMPGLGEKVRLAMGDVQNDYFRFLENFAQPEFNNPSGLFPIVFDIGYAGSVVYFLLAGVLVGLLWDGWRRRGLAGVLFYPIAVQFLIELLRFNYIASTRFFPVVLALGFVWLVARPAWGMVEQRPPMRIAPKWP